MIADENFKLFGLISILLTWTAIGYILVINKRDVAKSISHHVAMETQHHVIFSCLMTAALVAMYLFMVNWFIPVFHLPPFFSFIVVLAILLELIATAVPLAQGWRFTVHQLTSYGTALLLPVLLVTIALSPRLSIISFYVTVASTLCAGILLLLFLSVRKTRAHYLIYQSLYILSFHGALMFMTYFQ